MTEQHPTEKEHDMHDTQQVHVTPRKADQGGGWRVIVAAYDTQQAAIEDAKVIADELSAELLIHGEDGQIREKDSHGYDPKEIKG